MIESSMVKMSGASSTTALSFKFSKRAEKRQLAGAFAVEKDVQEEEAAEQSKEGDLEEKVTHLEGRTIKTTQ